MTATTVTSITHTGNNAATLFSFPFKISVSDEIGVSITQISTGSTTTLTAAQFLVTRIDPESGGDVRYPLSGSPLSTDYRITIAKTTAVAPGGGGGTAGGTLPTVLWSTLASTDVDEDVDVVFVSGYAEVGDAIFTTAQVITDGTILESDVIGSDGRRWRYSMGTLALENFGAKGDYDEPSGTATTDCYPAMRAVAEWATYWTRGEVKLLPGRHYSITTPFIWDLGGVNGGAYGNLTSPRADGRSITHLPPNAETQGNQLPSLAGVDGFIFDGQGSVMHSIVPWKLTAADDYHDPGSGGSSRTPKTGPMMPFHFWLCRNVTYRNIRFEGHWSDMTSECAGSGQRMMYGLRAVGCKRFRFENVVWNDWPADATTVTHRYRGTLNGISLVDMEGIPSPDETTSSIYSPDGRSEDWTFVNCRTLYAGRNGHSPVGVFGWRYYDGEISHTYTNQSAAGLWKTGDPEGALYTYQLPPTLPGAAVDFEPDRNSGEQCADLEIVNCLISYNFIEFGALGDAGRIRVQTAFSTTDVSAAADTITMTNCPLPRAIEGYEYPDVRFFSTGTLPAGIERYKSYFLSKTDANTIKLHTKFEDAVAGTNPVDITDVGNGTHYGAVYNSVPCVDKLIIRGCHIITSDKSGGALLTGVCPVTEVTNNLIDIIDPYAQIKHLGIAGRGTTSFRANRIRAAAQAFGNFPSKQLKTLDGATDVNFNSDVFTSVGFSPDNGGSSSLPDAMGRYAYTPVRVYTSSGTLPPPLKAGVVYYLTRLDADTFKLSYSLEDAEAGNYVDITAVGSGNFSIYWDYGHKIEIEGNTIIGIGAQEEFPGRRRDIPFDSATADPATDTVYAYKHGLCLGEQLRLLPWAGGTLPSGLSEGTTYFAIPVTENTVAFATTRLNAQADSRVDITAAASGKFRVFRYNLQLIDITGYVPTSFVNNRVFVPGDWNDGVTSTTIVNLLNTEAIVGNTFQTDLDPATGLTFFASFGQTPGVKANAFIPELTWGIAGTGPFVEVTSNCSQNYFEVDYTPTSLNAGQVALQSVAVPEMTINGHVDVTLPGYVAGINLLRVYPQTGLLSFVWQNTTAGALSPPAGTYRGVLTRKI